MNQKIEGTDEAWDTGLLGCDENHVEQLSPEIAAVMDKVIDEALGFVPIRVRIKKEIDDYLNDLAAKKGLNRDFLVREAISAFIKAEKL